MRNWAWGSSWFHMDTYLILFSSDPSLPVPQLKRKSRGHAMTRRFKGEILEEETFFMVASS